MNQSKEEKDVQEITALKEVVSQYPIDEINSAKLIDGGLVNVSYKVETPNGDFVFQRLSPIWDERVIHDYCAVQSVLRLRKCSLRNLCGFSPEIAKAFSRCSRTQDTLRVLTLSS